MALQTWLVASLDSSVDCTRGWHVVFIMLVSGLAGKFEIDLVSCRRTPLVQVLLSGCVEPGFGQVQFQHKLVQLLPLFQYRGQGGLEDGLQLLQHQLLDGHLILHQILSNSCTDTTCLHQNLHHLVLNIWLKIILLT